jgi:MFS family permease
MFDIYLPVVVLSPVLGFLPAPHLSAGMEAILASLVFITTLLGRPIGALLFGMIADRRRPAQGVDLVGVRLWRGDAVDRAAARL